MVFLRRRVLEGTVYGNIPLRDYLREGETVNEEDENVPKMLSVESRRLNKNDIPYEMVSPRAANFTGYRLSIIRTDATKDSTTAVFHFAVTLALFG